MAPKGNQKKAKGPTLEELQALADEMNEVMGLDPAIEYDDETDIEDLKIEILNNCFDEDDNCEIYTTDEFSEESWDTFKKLNVDPVDPDSEPEQEPEPEPEPEKKKGPAAGGKRTGGAPAGKKPGKKDPEPEPEPEPEPDEPSLEDDIAAVDDSDDIEEIKDIAKDHGIRIPPPFLKNIAKLKEYVSGKLSDMLEEQGGGDPEPEPEPETKPGRGGKRPGKKEAEEEYQSPSSAKKDPRRGGKKSEPEPEKKKGGGKKTESKSRYTRATAWAEAVAELDGPIGLNELAERADDIYCEKTGREDASNIREAKWLQTHGINILTGLGLAEVVDDQFNYKG